MKNLSSIERIWSLEQDLTGKLQLIVPAFCHATHGKIEDYSSLFATSKTRNEYRERGTLST